VEGSNGNNGYLARSASGDIYAGANGNVYKRDDGQWYQNRNGSWNAVEKADLSAQRQQAAARDLGNRNSAVSEQWRTRAESSGRAGGFEQRPHFQGGTRRR
jgi:hypothetical protein